MQTNHANGGKPKMRENRLRSVNCNGALKQRGVKYTGLKQGVGVLVYGKIVIQRYIQNT
jgi:hypothetical protein